MKWIRWTLLGLLLFVVLCVLGLLIAGQREGAETMSVRVEVNKPVAEVWKYFNTPEKTKDWVSWMVEVKDISPGEKRVGSKETWVMEDKNNNNQRMEIFSEVTAIEAMRRIDYKLGSTEMFTGTATYLFEDLGGNRTAFTSSGSYVFLNGFFNFLKPLIMHSAREKLEGDLKTFKANVEKQ